MIRSTFLFVTVLVVLTSLSVADSTGKWRIFRSTSAMDDSKTVVVELTAENFIKGWLSEYSPVLVIRCKENKTELYIRTGMSSDPEYGLYNEHTVRIRLDDGKPFKQRWSDSTDNEALFAPKSIALAKDIAKSKKMLFEFTPFSSSPQTVEFDVQGLMPHLEELAKTCNWKI